MTMRGLAGRAQEDFLRAPTWVGSTTAPRGFTRKNRDTLISIRWMLHQEKRRLSLPENMKCSKRNYPKTKNIFTSSPTKPIRAKNNFTDWQQRGAKQKELLR